MTTSTSGGAGGSGGCEPNFATDCYSGPAGTENIGDCHGGQAICEPDGMGYGPCLGEVVPIVEACGIEGDQDCNGFKDDHCGIWAEMFGQGGEQRAQAVAVDAEGNIVVAGRMAGTMTVGGTMLAGAGGFDAFVLKLDKNGQPLWAKSFGDGTNQEALGVAVDPMGNVLVVGYFHGTVDLGGGAITSAGVSDAFVLKLSPSGAFVWSKIATGVFSQYGNAVITDAAGNVLVGGGFTGQTDFGAAGGPVTGTSALDAFVWKIAPAGTTSWIKYFGGGGDDEVLALDIGPMSQPHATGYFDTSVDFGMGAISDGGGTDIFVVRMDPTTGAFLQGAGFAAPGEQGASSISVNGVGEILLGGSARVEVSFAPLPTVPVTGTEEDVFAVKLDKNLQPLWLRTFGDDLSQAASGAIFDKQGDVVMAFSNDGVIDLGGGVLSSAGPSDVVIAKLAGADGAHVWSRQFGDANDQDPRALTVTSTNSILVVGELSGTMALGPGLLLDNVSGDDAWVASFPP